MAIVVYMVECADLTFYTGWTTDLERRLKLHNAGRGAKYTRSRRPVQLVYFEQLPDRRSAMRRERQIKGMSRSEKLGLIKDFQVPPICLSDVSTVKSGGCEER